MARAATETQKAGLTGLEFGLAIPGTVGGAVWANAGAHDADMAGVLESARVLDGQGAEAIVPVADLGLSYRDSRFKHAPPDAPPDLILDATFQLSPADPDTIKARLDDIRRWRQAHQPLGLPSAGSVFRNPDGDSAGRLIEAAGLKGHRIGGAVVSEKHANFIVNDQKGTAADVRRLGGARARRRRRAPRHRAGVRDRVHRRLGRLAVAGLTRGDDASARCHADRRPARRAVGRARRLGRVGHGHRDRAGRGRRERPPGADRPRRRVVVAAGRPPPRRPATRPPTTTRAALGAEGPVAVGAAPGPAGGHATRRRWSSSACTARSARTARSRRCSTRPGWRTRAPGVAASALGMDKALFKRMCRGLGIPVVDWREVPARAGRPTGRPCAARWRRSPPAPPTPD